MGFSYSFAALKEGVKKNFKEKFCKDLFSRIKPKAFQIFHKDLIRENLYTEGMYLDAVQSMRLFIDEE